MGQHPSTGGRVQHVHQLLEASGRRGQRGLRRRAPQRWRGNDCRQLWHIDRYLVGLRQPRTRRVLPNKQPWVALGLRRGSQPLDRCVGLSRRRHQGVEGFCGRQRATSRQLLLSLRVARRGCLFRRSGPHTRLPHGVSRRNRLPKGTNQRGAGLQHLPRRRRATNGDRGRALQAHQLRRTHVGGGQRLFGQRPEHETLFTTVYHPAAGAMGCGSCRRTHRWRLQFPHIHQRTKPNAHERGEQFHIGFRTRHFLQCQQRQQRAMVAPLCGQGLLLHPQSRVRALSVHAQRVVDLCGAEAVGLIGHRPTTADVALHS